MEQGAIRNLLGSWSLGSGPLYRLLAQALEKAIVQGDIPVGTRLPAERVFALEIAVSRSTVAAAYALLEQKEIVESRHGSGTVVRSHWEDRTETQHASTTRTFGREPLFEQLISDPRDLIDLTMSAPEALDSLSVDAFALEPSELAALLGKRETAPLGLPKLRRAIAQHLEQAGVPTTEQQVLITAGAQQALSLVSAMYVQRGDTVVIENPTYFGALDVFRSLGARLMPVPVDSGGVRVDVLGRVLATYVPRLVYLTPTFHNPTGAALLQDRRREVARLAAEFGVPVVEDNACADLILANDGPAPIAVYAKAAPVITIGSLNKLFWQGLRIGWVRAPESIIDRLGRLKVIADLGTSLISQAIALRLMPHVDRVKMVRRRELERRLDLLTGWLQSFLPCWTWQRPEGGVFLWVRLPFGDAREFARVALGYGVVVTPGTTMSVDESCHEYLRLPFLTNPEMLKAGVERLAQAWEVYALSRGECVEAVNDGVAEVT